ncbi:MAG: TetR/AcrR family transcriptional regulator [Micromonosporaceae bacterium]
MGTRNYRKRSRAEAEAGTARRIARAALELHETVGPARTTIADIARRAGVSRVTVYSHFPDELALLGACTGIWAQEHPPPDLDVVATASDPEAATRTTLGAFYHWYDDNEAMLGNSVRDATLVPALAQLHQSTSIPYQNEARDRLLSGFALHSRHREEVRALIGLALDFHTWRALTRTGGLSTDHAADLTTKLILAASAPAGVQGRHDARRTT